MRVLSAKSERRGNNIYSLCARASHAPPWCVGECLALRTAGICVFPGLQLCGWSASGLLAKLAGVSRAPAIAGKEVLNLFGLYLQVIAPPLARCGAWCKRLWTRTLRDARSLCHTARAPQTASEHMALGCFRVLIPTSGGERFALCRRSVHAPVPLRHCAWYERSTPWHTVGCQRTCAGSLVLCV